MAEFFPLIELKGSAYEIGFQHGKVLAGKSFRSGVFAYDDGCLDYH